MAWLRLFSHGIHGIAQMAWLRKSSHGFHGFAQMVGCVCSPTEFTEFTEVWGCCWLRGYGRMPYPPNLCASVLSVGDSSLQETSVCSVRSVGFIPACFVGAVLALTGGKAELRLLDSGGCVGMAGCHTLLHLCKSVPICGRYFSARRFRVFCAFCGMCFSVRRVRICGRLFSARRFRVFRAFCGRRFSTRSVRSVGGTSQPEE